MDVMKNLITAEEVASMLNLSRATVWRWCRDGMIPHRRLAGRTILFCPKEIERWILSNSAGPVVPAHVMEPGCEILQSGL
jgi:excisionase family DNA binding protein